MNVAFKIAAGLALGVLMWTLFEYFLHRFAGHASWLGRTVRKEHFTHHATPDYFTPWRRKLLLAAPILSVVGAVGYLLAGPAGLAAAAGLAASWVFYEQLHQATHISGPRNAYGEWARRHHLHHHFQSPKANHGVTTPLWDYVFGTLERPSAIAVPRRHVRCFAWLLDDEGGIDPRYADLYRLV